MPTLRLETPRLILRPLIQDDWTDVYAYDSQPEVVRYLSWGPNSPADTLAFVTRAAADNQLSARKMYKFAVLLSETNKLIGNCNLFMKGEDEKEASIEFLFHPQHWGNGFAAETVGALLRFGFEELGLHRMIANCHTEDVASQRVLEKNLMRQEGRFRKHLFARGTWVDIFLYALLKDEWLAPRSRAVIFDMDGVLVNTEPIYLSANRAVFKRLGISVSDEEYGRFIGVSAEHMWSELKRTHHLPEPVPVLVRREADACARSLMQTEIEPMPGVSVLIDKLEAERIPMAVASSSSHRVIQIILNRLGLLEKFVAVTSGDDVLNGKPAPDIFLLAASRLGIRPENCLVIEDSSHGVRGAKAAGMFAAGFIGEHDTNQDLSPADIIISGFRADAFERLTALFKNPDKKP